MVPNAANIDKDWAWMSQIADKMGMELGKDFVNESEQWAQLAVQGPNALKAMQKLTDENIVDMEYYTFKILTFAGIPDIILSTTGYTGRNTASCPQALAAATPSVWRKASPSTATRWTTPSAPSRPLWHSSSS